MGRLLKEILKGLALARYLLVFSVDHTVESGDNAAPLIADDNLIGSKSSGFIDFGGDRIEHSSRYRLQIGDMCIYRQSHLAVAVGGH